MKSRPSSTNIWQAALLLIACLTAANPAARAQQFGTSVSTEGGHGVGFGIAGSQQGGSGPRQFAVFLASPDGVSFGEKLLKACDVNQDGSAGPAEIKTALLAWFQRADTDTNSALSQAELSAALKELLPMPQPPAGLPAPPEEYAPYNVFAKNLMARVDANKDGWLTFKEAIVYIGGNLAQWDSDNSGSLVASEFDMAFAQAFAPDGAGPVTFGQAGPGTPGVATFRTR